MARKKAQALPRPEPEMLTVYGDIVQETEDAILVECGGDEAVWLPKSQIEYDGERGDTDVEISLPDLLAEKNSLVDGQGSPAAGEPGDQTLPISASEEGEGIAAEEGEGEITEVVEQPSTFTFRADVEHVYDEKYVLLVSNEQGGTASLEFDKDAVGYDGQDAADLQEGYQGIEFTVSWELAAEKHLPEFLGVSTSAPAEGSVVPAETSADDDNEAAPQARTYHRKLREESITAEVGLTHKELEECTKRISRAWAQRTEYKEKATFYSGRARDSEKEMNKAIDALNAGREVRTVDCDVMGDFNAGMVIWVEKDSPFREIQRRPMTDSDRQLLLPIETAPAPKPQQASVPAVLKTVTLYGSLMGTTEIGVSFLVLYGDAAGTEATFDIPREQVISMQARASDDEQDIIILIRDYAIEAGIIDDPEEPASPSRECDTCVHDCMPDDDACERCDDELSGWYPSAEDAQKEEPAERSCGTCAHIHAVPDPEGGEVDSPCQSCGDGDLPNWTPAAIPAAGGETHTEAVQ